MRKLLLLVMLVVPLAMSGCVVHPGRHHHRGTIEISPVRTHHHHSPAPHHRPPAPRHRPPRPPHWRP